jgi:Pin2-interacting protein X1
LNGNEEEVKKEEERQEKIEQRAYVYRKYGFMNFVSGGFLVGDKITRDIKEAQEAQIKKEALIKVEIKSEPESSDGGVKENKSKKRKRSGEEPPVEEEQKLKRKKKSVDLRQEAAKKTGADESATRSKDKKDKKSKKPSSDSSALDSPAPVSTEPLTDKARRKAEKRARKEEKQLKKALKKAAKEVVQSNPTTNDPSSESEEEDITPVSSVITTGTSTPSSAAGLTFSAGGRHAVRQRYIRQKRMALMDPQALKEVC